jgi:hypothetical protein
MQGIVVERRHLERVGDPGSVTLRPGAAGVYLIEIVRDGRTLVRKVAVK